MDIHIPPRPAPRWRPAPQHVTPPAGTWVVRPAGHPDPLTSGACSPVSRPIHQCGLFPNLQPPSPVCPVPQLPDPLTSLACFSAFLSAFSASFCCFFRPFLDCACSSSPALRQEDKHNTNTQVSFQVYVSGFLEEVFERVGKCILAIITSVCPPHPLPQPLHSLRSRAFKVQPTL